jgi:hypothetical protein
MNLSQFRLLHLASGLLLFISGCAGIRSGEEPPQYPNYCSQQRWERIWQSYLNETLQIGEGRQHVEQKLENKYLYKIEMPFNSASIYAVVYRVDDMGELYLEFNAKDNTLRKCLAIGPTSWFRNPDTGQALYVIDRKSGETY